MEIHVSFYDSYKKVAIDKGTGCVMCCTFGDQTDIEWWKKYKLPLKYILTVDGKISESVPKYGGLKIKEARAKIIEDLKIGGFVVKIEDIEHEVQTHERCGKEVEYSVMKQWFIDTMKHKEDFIKIGNEIKWHPAHMHVRYDEWVNNIAWDWCISRQLWWGHRIPVWYHNETGEIYCEVDPPKDIENYTQDEDVLDTWFSSALWPFSVLGWPDNTKDLQRYFPTSCMVTGYDIIFFWVSRMIFQSLEMTKRRPFKEVVIHGLVRDELGRKMSKSLGNGVDPIEVIDKYGADALRYFLTTNAAPGQDMRYIEEKVIASSNYLNKIWNSARYVLSVLPEDFREEEIQTKDLSSLDQWIINRLEKTIKAVTMNMEKYDFNAASSHLYNFVYDDFCSQYLEMSKVSISSSDEKVRNTTYQVLHRCLKDIILLIYPYTPFIGEELYLNLPNHKESIMLETYPKYDASKVHNAVDKQIDVIFSIIRDVRNYKIENKLAPNAKLDLSLNLRIKMFKGYESYLERFTFSSFKLVDDSIVHMRGELKIYDNADLLITNEAGLDDIIKRIDKEIEETENEILRCEKMLNNPNFIFKAPKEKVALEEEKLKKHKENLALLKDKKSKLL